MSNLSTPSQLSFDTLGAKAAAKPPVEPKKDKKTAPKGKLAPMLQQYVDVKKQYPEHVLLFQVGDFYEVFFDDAELVAEVLSIRLTSRDKNSPDPVPMCGVPIHAIDGYLPKLIAAGHSCALMSQVEDAKASKGMVRREITRIITPGVRYEGDGLDERDFNYLASATLSARGTGAVSFVDVSTGYLRVVEVSSEEELLQVVERVSPAELIIPSTLFDIAVETSKGWLRSLKRLAKDIGAHTVTRPFIKTSSSKVVSRVEGLLSSTDSSVFMRERAQSLAEEAQSCVDVTLDYIEEISTGQKAHLARFVVEDPKRAVFIDATTRRNLEIFETRVDANRKNSLIYHIDFTKTSMGGRLLGDWLMSPCTEPVEISERHDAVEALIDSEHLSSIRSILTEVRDLERLITRVTTNRAHPRDLKTLAESISRLPEVKSSLEHIGSSLLGDVSKNFDSLEDVFSKLDSSLIEDPPVKLTEGGIFKDGYHDKVDELRTIARDGRSWIAELEAKEKEKTGITALKVKYNNVFGYFIEVTKAHLNKVPDYFERKQTLVNAERFVTKELKELEVSVLSARTRQVDLERELFVELRKWLSEQAARIQSTSYLLSCIDVLCSFAELARRKNYVRPIISDGNETKIVGGRHPVIEGIIGETNFIPNDLELNGDDRRFAVLTGPNMGGKSTYLRQAGIVQLLAQAGSFVPAASAQLGLVDRIFTRIGTGDDITRGDSTFMVEMREITCIIRQASSRSLVLIDEIGRGTATSDGLAIATAIAEWLHDSIACRTIFATHFHELTDLKDVLEGAFCVSVGIIEKDDDIIFTHRIEERPADRSYGIEVAKLAGLPESLLVRARSVLDGLNSAEVQKQPCSPKKDELPSKERIEVSKNLRQLSDKIRSFDPNAMTPLEALSELASLKELIE